MWAIDIQILALRSDQPAGPFLSEVTGWENLDTTARVAEVSMCVIAPRYTRTLSHSAS